MHSGGAGHGISQVEQKHNIEAIFKDSGIPTTNLQATMFMEEFWKVYTRPQIMKVILLSTPHYAELYILHSTAIIMSPTDVSFCFSIVTSNSIKHKDFKYDIPDILLLFFLWFVCVQTVQGTFPFSMPGDKPLQLLAVKDMGLAAGIALKQARFSFDL